MEERVTIPETFSTSLGDHGNKSDPVIERVVVREADTNATLQNDLIW